MEVRLTGAAQAILRGSGHAVAVPSEQPMVIRRRRKARVMTVQDKKSKDLETPVKSRQKNQKTSHSIVDDTEVEKKP